MCHLVQCNLLRSCTRVLRVHVPNDAIPVLSRAPRTIRSPGLNSAYKHVRTTRNILQIVPSNSCHRVFWSLVSSFLLPILAAVTCQNGIQRSFAFNPLSFSAHILLYMAIHDVLFFYMHFAMHKFQSLHFVYKYVHAMHHDAVHLMNGISQLQMLPHTWLIFFSICDRLRGFWRRPSYGWSSLGHLDADRWLELVELDVTF